MYMSQRRVARTEPRGSSSEIVRLRLKAPCQETNAFLSLRKPRTHLMKHVGIPFLAILARRAFLQTRVISSGEVREKESCAQRWPSLLETVVDELGDCRDLLFCGSVPTEPRLSLVEKMIRFQEVSKAFIEIDR